MKNVEQTRIEVETVQRVFDQWCLGERKRLLQQEHRLFSDVERLKTIAAIDKNDSANNLYQKTLGHIGRVGLRLNQLVAKDFDPDVAGFTVFSCLKLAVGQQVRLAYTTSTNQESFESIMIRPSACIVDIDEDGDYSQENLFYKYGLLKKELPDLLDETTDRANAGLDWGMSDSRSVELIREGEQASYDMATAVVFTAASVNGSLENIALRPPSSDADEVNLEYPFV